MAMFIRKTSHSDKNTQKAYHTFKLIESVRTERGPRQRMLLNLGTDFSLPEERWKELANRIEEIILGQDTLLSVSEEVETLAIRYGNKLIRYQGALQPEEGERAEPDYHRVDIHSVENERCRSIGAEHVVYETIKSLELDRLLMGFGFNKAALDTAIGVIAARLINPCSERATHVWLQGMTGLDELLETDFSDLSQDRVYRTSDLLLRHKKEIEEHLRAKERNLFNLEEKIVLYDLTNTFFEGSARYNPKARFGVSKEKRSDCPLVTLGLVLDGDGFPKRTEVFEGNVSEPGTLKEMVTRLCFEQVPRHPMIVMDAGIGTEGNILWLKEQGYAYLVVSRKKKSEVSALATWVSVREDRHRVIRVAITQGDDPSEITLYCHSTDKEVKERGIKNRFETRFELELEKVKKGLSKPRGTKRYEKVVEKIGRLKERFRRVSRRYDITVMKEKETERATDVTWVYKGKEDSCGLYCLRSNRLDLNEQQLFDIFAMLTDVEDAFRSMKSELGLRPIRHHKEYRSDGHLFITVLAYHVMHTIRMALRRHAIHETWTTVRAGLSSQVRISTTMKRDDGKRIHIRKTSMPELYHRKIYAALGCTHRPGVTIKTIL
jgi:transposase